MDDFDYKDLALEDDICYIDEHVYVMKCTLSTPIDIDSWKRTSIFHAPYFFKW